MKALRWLVPQGKSIGDLHNGFVRVKGYSKKAEYMFLSIQEPIQINRSSITTIQQSIIILILARKGETIHIKSKKDILPRPLPILYPTYFRNKYVFSKNLDSFYPTHDIQMVVYNHSSYIKHPDIYQKRI